VWIENIVAFESSVVNYLGLGLVVFKKQLIEIKRHNSWYESLVWCQLMVNKLKYGECVVRLWEVWSFVSIQWPTSIAFRGHESGEINIVVAC
jgi:hypothetical protein